jgi:hypothetical protein
VLRSLAQTDPASDTQPAHAPLDITRMANDIPLIPRLVEPVLWQRAGWVAVAFLTPRDLSPTLGLVFRDRDTATAIFTGWQHMLGKTDTDELLRVAVIEGSLPGQPPGYTVHVGLDVAVAEQRLRDAGIALAAPLDDRDQASCRMLGSGGTALRRFADAYDRGRRYLLVPAVLDTASGIEYLPHLVIAKHRLAFRRVSDVGLIADADAAIFAPLSRGMGAR